MSVTCILPVYNGERFLAEALDSVLDQNVSDLEVLVVDDGSTDCTAAILDRYGPKIRVVRQENLGVSPARNRGLDEAGSEYIAFQDCDDLWMPGKLARQLAAFEERPELDLCLGMVQNFWMDELAAEERAYRGSSFAAPAPGYLLQALVARRSAFERVGRFDTTLGVGEDNDWFLRARDAGLVEEMIPDVLVRRRLHLNNLTRDDLASRDAILANMKASLDRRRSGGSA